MSNNQVKKSTPVQGHIHVHPIDKYIEMLTTTTSSITSSDAGSVNAIASKALSDPKVFSGFSELSGLPLVQHHASQALLNTLELFSFGTYLDYCSKSDATINIGIGIGGDGGDGDGDGNGQEGGFYNRLTEAQLIKLKALTVVSTINRYNDDNDAATATETTATETREPQSQSRRSRRRQILQQTSTAANVNSTTTGTDPTNNNNITNTSGIITYATLQAQLNHPNTNNININANTNTNTNTTQEEIRKLEDLLIHCIYSNLLPCGTKLDQKNLQITVKLASASASASQVTTSSVLDASHVLCRDVHLEKDLPNMIRTLEEFFVKGQDTQKRLEDLEQGVGRGVRGDLEDWKEIDLEILLKESRVGSGDGSGKMDDNGKGGAGVGVGTMEWSSSAGMDRQVKRSRAAGGSGSGGSGRNSGFFGFGKKG